jgi:hypothetical protein
MTSAKPLSATALAQLRAVAEAQFDYCILCLLVLEECTRRNAHEPVSLRSTVATIEASELTPGAKRIAQERARQIHGEGYTAEHDDEHCRGELSAAAVAYITPVRAYYRSETPAKGIVFSDPWPFAPRFDRRHRLYAAGAPPAVSSMLAKEPHVIDARVELLEKGGAFAAAEIDRLLRLAEKP